MQRGMRRFPPTDVLTKFPRAVLFLFFEPSVYSTLGA